MILSAAIIGAVVGAVFSIVSQAASGNEISWRSVGASALAGAVTGALMAIPGAQGAALSFGQSMLWGGLAGGIGYGVYNLANGTEATVSGYATSMATSAAAAGIGYALANGKITYKSQGSTGRTTANNLKEQLSMKQVVSNPLSGAKRLTNMTMSDKRWLASAGWAKYENIVNGVKIHFNYNSLIGIFDDFKFK